VQTFDAERCYSVVDDIEGILDLHQLAAARRQQVYGDGFRKYLGLNVVREKEYLSAMAAP
jgi:hypothetical protein